MAKWYPKGNIDKSGLFEACMWTGDNLGFINSNFNEHFYADNSDTLWANNHGEEIGCRPGSYIALQNGEYVIYDDKEFNELYEAYKE